MKLKGLKPSSLLTSAVVTVAPARMFNSAVVAVTPSNLLSSVAEDVTEGGKMPAPISKKR